MLLRTDDERGLRPRCLRLLPAATAAALTLATLQGCTGGATDKPRATPTSTSAAHAPAEAALSTREAAAIATGLAGPDPSAVLAPALRTAAESTAHALVPAGTKLRVDPRTMRVDGNTATVRAEVTAGGAQTTATRYDLLLVQVDGKWLVYGTRSAS